MALTQQYDSPGPVRLSRAAWRFDLRLPKGGVRVWRRTWPATVIGDTVLLGALDWRYHALDLRTGRPRWSVAARGAPGTRGALAPPIAWDAETALLFRDSEVLGVDVESGAVRFTMSAPAIEAPPALQGTRLLHAAGTMLRVVEVPSGERRFECDLGAETLAPIAWHDDIAVVRLLDGTTVAIDTARGVERWRVKSGRAGTSAVALHDGRAYVATGEGCRLDVHDLQDGARRWSKKVYGMVFGTPLIGGGLVVVASSLGGNPATLHAFDAASGDARWDAKIDRLAAGVNASVALGSGEADARIYAGADMGLHVLSLTTGSPIAQARLTHVCGAAPVVAGSSVLTATTHHLVCHRG